MFPIRGCSERIICPYDPVEWGVHRHNLNVTDWIRVPPISNHKHQTCLIFTEIRNSQWEKAGVSPTARAARCITFSHADYVFSAMTSSTVLFSFFFFCFSVQNNCNQQTTTVCLHVCVLLKSRLITRVSPVPGITTLKSFSINTKCVVLRLAWIVWCVRSCDWNIKNQLSLSCHVCGLPRFLNSVKIWKSSSAHQALAIYQNHFSISKIGPLNHPPSTHSYSEEHKTFLLCLSQKQYTRLCAYERETGKICRVCVCEQRTRWLEVGDVLSPALPGP